MGENTNIYDLYKPFRHYTRQFNILESLSVIRAYLQFLQFGEQLPNTIEVNPEFLQRRNGLNKMVHEWELELLVREIIVNRDHRNSGRKSLRGWGDLSTAINKIRELKNSISKNSPDVKEKILLEMHRIAHR